MANAGSKHSQTKTNLSQRWSFALTMEMNAIEAKVSALKAKYSTLAGKLRGSAGDGGGGEGRSQVYYMIKRAQEREELQNKGDALDRQISHTEKEVRLLYNSCQHLVRSNAAYRDSFRNGEARSDN